MNKNNNEKGNGMSDIKQCWAFHRDNSRCEHPAGHAGLHMTEKSWSDEECATPEEPYKTKTQKPVVEQEQSVKQATNCVTCNHHHVGGVCKCGCYEQIG
jgi:hypothetical protein